MNCPSWFKPIKFNLNFHYISDVRFETSFTYYYSVKILYGYIIKFLAGCTFLSGHQFSFQPSCHSNCSHRFAWCFLELISEVNQCAEVNQKSEINFQICWWNDLIQSEIWNQFCWTCVKVCVITKLVLWVSWREFVLVHQTEEIDNVSNSGSLFRNSICS